MEYGFPLFDPNSESDAQSQRLKEYYESFSANARLRLLSKTVINPTSVYDVLYPQTRAAQLNRNNSIFSDIEEDSKMIRDRMVSRVVSEETDLEKISKDFRDSLLARTKVHDDKNDLLSSSEAFRKSNIYSSNKDINLERDSVLSRDSNLSKNKNEVSSDSEKSGEKFRELNVSKNTSFDSNLLRDSAPFRKNSVSKNIDKASNLEDSEFFRESNLHKNQSKEFDLDRESKRYRDSSVYKNVKKETDAYQDSIPFRNRDLSRNVDVDINLERDSEDFRNDSIKLNVERKTDIESESVSFRKTSLSKNKQDYFDQDEYSRSFRDKNISSNKPLESDLDNDSEPLRSEAISKNKAREGNLELDSSSFRSSSLSKNDIKKTDLDVDSIYFRDMEMSKNKSKDTDLEESSRSIRNKALSAIEVKNSNLLELSKSFRAGGLSMNSPKLSDLEKDSSEFKENNMSFNILKSTDLESDSGDYRANNLSLNKLSYTDLQVDSPPFRISNESRNRPIDTDLEVDSVPFRDNVLSFNSNVSTDLEVDSVPFRDNVLSFNSNIETDLESDSIVFRDNNTSSNSPNNSDLEVDSVPFRDNVISSNAPSYSDLEVDSIPFRDNVLASNVPSAYDLESGSSDFRDNNMALNSSNQSDLDSDSFDFRENLMSSNVSSESDLSEDSTVFRENLMSSNVLSESDLLSDSDSFRKQSVAKNSGFGLLGVNISGAGTSSFLGVSRVFVQGALLRKMLMSKNKPKRMDLEGDTHVFRENNIQKNKWRVSENEYTSTALNWDLSRVSQGSKKSILVDFSSLDRHKYPTKNSLLTTDDYVKNEGKNLQALYGTSQSLDFPTERKDRRVSDSVYYVDSLSKNGGGFDGASMSVDTWSYYKEGNVTSLMRNYNQERNVFNLKGLQPGNPGTVSELKGLSNDGFQDLIKSTIGSFRGGGQTRTITTPSDIIQKNKGTYHAGGASGSDIMRPGGEGEKLGSAKSMMAKTVPGNPYDDEDFFTGKRGVKYVVNTIKNGGEELSKNYDPQYSKAYLIGTNRDGSPKLARQKYTISNPNAPEKAGKLLFSLKNYSSGDQFFFPPYIQSISNNETASWNTVNFLGRPEAMYTYNNSTRDATIVFHVLTDYAEKVDIGRDWGKDDAPRVSSSFGMHFTDSDVSQNKKRKLEQERIKKLQKELSDEMSELDEKKSANNIEQNTAGSPDEQVNYMPNFSAIANFDPFLNANTNREKRSQAERNEMFQTINNKGGSSELDKKREELAKQMSGLNEAEGDSINSLNKETNYSESSDSSGNVYGVNMGKKEYNGREIVSKPEDTIVRIDTMKQGLMFQPAYFSGDKVDFVRRIEFLSKLTRPSAASEQENTGFSFTKPPICHIRLGDWWNHDIVVNSVSYDYNDAPWTLDGGRVQPMWVTVSIGFNIIGPYGVGTGRPPLSTDEGGMYSPMK